MGTPGFAVPVLQALYQAGHEIACVITQPDRPRGRKGKLEPPEIKSAAQALGLNVFQFEKIREDEPSQVLEEQGACLLYTSPSPRD